MIDARVRLVFNAKLTDGERTACRRGADSFSRFNVRIEETAAGPDAGRLIRNGPLVSSLAGGDGPFRLDGSMFRPFRFSMSDCDTRMLVLGVTPHEMTDGRTHRFAVGKALAGAVISIADLRKMRSGAYRGIDDQTYSDTIEKMAEHAIGLTMLDQGCGTCIMQNVRDTAEFIERIARQRLDFCDPCKDRLRGTVASIRYYGMA
ncbi:MAG: hypothetical protein U0R44_02700 [Candidatus Micrarchaeia archaeon]